MKNKRLVINMIANMIAFGISMTMTFFLTPFLIKNVGTDAYGFVPLANQFISYANIIVMALNSMAARFITLKVVEENYEDVNIYFNSVLFSNIIISVILAIPIFFIIKYLQNILDIPTFLIGDVKILFTLVFISMLFSILTSVFEVATFCKNRIDLKSYRDVIMSVIRSGLLLGFFMFFDPSIIYIGIVNIIITLLTFFTAIYFTKKLILEIQINKSFFRVSAIKELLSAGVWNSFNQLSSLLLSGVDLLIANIMLGSTMGGVYSIVQILPNFIKSFISMILGVFMPQITIAYGKKDRELLIKEIYNANKILALLISLALTFLLVYGDIFFKLWVPTENNEMLHRLSILIILPMIISGGINILFNVFTVTNNLKVPSIVMFGTGVINIVLVFILLKTTNLGIYSIPICSGVLGVIRNCIFTPIYASKCIGAKWNAFYKDILNGIIFIIINSIIFITARHVFIIDSWIKLIIVSCVVSIICLLINGIILVREKDTKKLNQAIKKNKLFHFLNI